MKRLFVFAAVAASLAAVSCQKTYVIDQVNTPIGFSANLGKQTKAIMDGTTYDTGHTFGVFAYALTDNKSWETDAATTDAVMNNVEIGYMTDTWKAKNGTKYYWPNAIETSLNFFMYSPYDNLKTFASVSPTDGLKISNYEHSNTNHMGTDAVDILVASVPDKKYADAGTTPGTVDFSFKHKMTQVVFVVKKDASIDAATVKLNSLDLLNIKNKGTYTEKTDSWNIASGESDKTNYQITNSDAEVVASTGITLEGATMLPQQLSYDNQQIKIVYSITGENFADETVTKTFNLTSIL